MQSNIATGVSTYPNSPSANQYIWAKGLLTVLIMVVAAAPSYARDYNQNRGIVKSPGTSYQRVPVTQVEPIYERVTTRVPVEQCYEERVAYSDKPRAKGSATGTIVGAIIGGALGNAVGHSKRNRQVGTVVGAVLGGSVGTDIARAQHRKHHRHHDEVRYRTEEVCHIEEELREEEKIAAYNVTYEYAGQPYTTRMRRDPGEFMRVRVRVSPVQ